MSTLLERLMMGRDGHGVDLSAEECGQLLQLLIDSDRGGGTSRTFKTWMSAWEYSLLIGPERVNVDAQAHAVADRFGYRDFKQVKKNAKRWKKTIDNMLADPALDRTAALKAIAELHASPQKPWGS